MPRQAAIRPGGRHHPDQIAKAIALLSWIKDQGETPATCRQAQIDLWLTSEDHQGPYSARPFVTWAVRSKFAFNISIPARPRRVFHRPLDADARWSIARRLLNDDSIETKDRVAGLMVLLYGQTPARTCRPTTAHVIHDGKGVALQLREIPLRLPPPLDAPVLRLVGIANDHQHTVMANASNAPWLFPTQQPGKHLTSKQFLSRLRKIGLPSEAARCAALLDICTTMPAGVLERLLGISPAAASRWAAEVARRSDADQTPTRLSITSDLSQRCPRRLRADPTHPSRHRSMQCAPAERRAPRPYLYRPPPESRLLATRYRPGPSLRVLARTRPARCRRHRRR